MACAHETLATSYVLKNLRVAGYSLMSLSVPLAQGLLGDTFLNFLLGWGGSASGTVPQSEISDW